MYMDPDPSLETIFVNYVRRVEEILASNLTEANSILPELSYQEDYEYEEAGHAE